MTWSAIASAMRAWSSACDQPITQAEPLEEQLVD
jgi:hypothetical protein